MADDDDDDELSLDEDNVSRFETNATMNELLCLQQRATYDEFFDPPAEMKKEKKSNISKKTTATKEEEV